MAEALGAIEKIQQTIKAGQFKEALEMTNLAEEQGSSTPELFYMKAVCHRYLEEHELALGVLSDLKALSPENGYAGRRVCHALGREWLRSPLVLPMRPTGGS